MAHRTAQLRTEPARFASAAFCIDIETVRDTGEIIKAGAYVPAENRRYVFAGAHGLKELDGLARKASFILGHNIALHDLQVLKAAAPHLSLLKLPAVDTLELSPLAFPRNPYHHLVKEYKLLSESLNDPAADAELSYRLFIDEIEVLDALRLSNPLLFGLFHFLLSRGDPPDGIAVFFKSLAGPCLTSSAEAQDMIARFLQGIACEKGASSIILHDYSGPEARKSLAYALAWLSVSGGNSVLPPWVLYQFPKVCDVIRTLREVPCNIEGCAYCDEAHNPKRQLGKFFGFPDFRKTPQNESGGSLQEDIVLAGMRGENLLAVLPTGAGKSLCYNLPALTRNFRDGSLTVVVSPLQALMKDQVDGLLRHGVISGAALNGLLTMPERREVLEKIRLGDTAILLISPEQTRSRSFRNAVKHRRISAWIFDEAHCLSKWGHDFRTDYLYVARFIREHSKGRSLPAVACFTATAKEDVIEDIRAHFRDQLGIGMRVFYGGHERANLGFSVVPVSATGKPAQIDALLRHHLGDGGGGAIVYTAFRRSAEDLSDHLDKLGWRCGHFHGGLTPEVKKSVQQDFINGRLDVIVATNAFGMGIDKSDVRLVLHAEVPGSLENYLQEAGRAGRDQLQANCVLLYDEQDVERQFNLIARTTLTRNDIAGILRALRRSFKPNREGNVVVSCGEILAEEEARTDFDRLDPSADTKVHTAVAWLERARLLERNENVISVFPGSLKVKSMQDAERRLGAFNLPGKRAALLLRVLSMIMNASPEDGITTDEIMDATGLGIEEVVKALHALEEMELLKNDLLLTFYLSRGIPGQCSERWSRVMELERLVLEFLREGAPDMEPGQDIPLNLRLFTQGIRNRGFEDIIPSQVLLILKSLADLRRDVPGESRKPFALRHLQREGYGVRVGSSWQDIIDLAETRRAAAGRILDFLLSRLGEAARGKDLLVEATVGELVDELRHDMFIAPLMKDPVDLIQSALLHLHDLEVLVLNRGLFVFRSAMTIRINQEERRRQFTQSDFESLELHYRERFFQVHIMEEYARLGVKELKEALALIAAYFTLPRKEFVARYFAGRREVLELATRDESFRKIVESLNNPVQIAIVADRGDTNTLVLAGPGSGKTRIVVHRVAFLLKVLRVSPRSIIVLAFNRYAAVEIRRRLETLVGPEGREVTVLTYHGLAMRLTGTSFSRHMRGDTAPDFDGILRNAVDLLNGKTVPGVDQDALRDVLLKGYRYILVDEYQDIDASQYDLISALAGRTLKDPDQRLTLLAVGDDDQNIYGFRHTSVEFIRKFREDYGAEVSYLVENYRSTVNIIESANVLISSNRDRMKRDNPIRIDHVRRREPPGGVWEGLDPGLARGRVQAIRGFVSDAHQAYGAMKELERLRTLGPSWDWSECAVLARNRKSLNPVRAYCEQNRIPCCWGEDDDKRPPFHQVRETASLLDFLRDNKGRLITASELLEKVGKGPPNSWRDLLTECLREFLEETEDLPVPPGSASEWIYEFGLELRRFARRGLWLNTVHSSKGTEFRHVVILDGGWAPAAGQTEEERRLYYVGMTRAQETLTLLELRGSRNAFIGAALEGAGGFARSAGAQAGPESLDRIYENLGLSDVDLSFSGRRAINDPIHGVMAELQVGDELTLRRNEDFRDLYRAQPHREKGIEWFLCDGKKRDVGRLARRYRLRNPNPVSIRVTAVVRRRIEQISDPEWRESCKVKSWEVPLCEIVY